ncbi:acyl carrier protein [Streptacidiphilus sp. N1-12]|uniref:Acyl carrier protein n=2 Tax=Streptacidiphilus alkalitolerans TaxID=3342712 RepID=A0ABV6VC32_9ACTN
MSSTPFTLDDLAPILVASAGDDSVDFAAGIDTDFESLGYDSLTLLEISSRIERQYGISLDDSPLTATDTPRELIESVNGLLTATV